MDPRADGIAPGPVELELHKRELDQLQQIANQVAMQIASMDLDWNAPSRITQIQPAMVTLVGEPSL